MEISGTEFQFLIDTNVKHVQDQRPKRALRFKLYAYFAYIIIDLSNNGDTLDVNGVLSRLIYFNTTHTDTGDGMGCHSL